MRHSPHSTPLRKRFAALERAALLAFTAAFILALIPNDALAVDPVYSNWRGLAIRGADPVAYFTEGKHIDGKSEFSLEYMNATWRFASAENKAAFESAPDEYAPQYGGYCAWAVSQGYTASIDPDVFTIVDGKLYLNYSEGVLEDWLADRDAFIAKADANWPGIRDD